MARPVRMARGDIDMTHPIVHRNIHVAAHNHDFVIILNGQPIVWTASGTP